MSDALPDISSMLDVLHKIALTPTHETSKVFCKKYSIPGDEAAEITRVAKQLDEKIAFAKEVCLKAIEAQTVEEHLRAIAEIHGVIQTKDKFMARIAKAESTHSLEH